MELVLSKASVKFLEKLSPKETEKLQERLAVLLQSLEAEGIIPFNELDIKSLKGEWKGFFRMRVGKVRVVFTIDLEVDALQVYDIDFRGNIYKALLLGSTAIRLSVTQKITPPKSHPEAAHR
ncbi:MAG: type II toxin-antitoxin system RelE/ParE family toxin [Lyngbya sp. HA4199-MV5]|jgi:mRNA interferase RelE/StbE|nr:type II toxin-antitoxin system RelE/ParE family toxin [Lyngbya sp. HA4199-MV5]